MTDQLLKTHESVKEKVTLKIIIIAIAACLLYGVLSGFRSDFAVVIGIINSSPTGFSYTDLQFANTICRFVSAFASPVVAFLTLKRSNLFVLTLGFITTISGLICIAAAQNLAGLIIGLGVLFALGSAALSFGIIFGIISPLVGEKAAIIISTIFGIATTFFGVIFSPLMQFLSNIIGYQAMLGVFCIILLCIFPLVFLISGKKNEAFVAKQKKNIRMKGALAVMFKSKITYVLILFFFISGFTDGLNNHLYTGELALNVPAIGVSVTFSLLEIIIAVASVAAAAIILKIKRAYLFGALVFILFGIIEFIIAFVPNEPLAYTPLVILSVIVCSALYPLSNLIVRREYTPVLVGSVICFASLFDKLGVGLNSILGGIIFDAFGNFDLLIILEALSAILLALVLIFYAWKAKDLLKQQLEERKKAEAEKKQEETGH